MNMKFCDEEREDVGNIYRDIVKDEVKRVYEASAEDGNKGDLIAISTNIIQERLDRRYNLVLTTQCARRSCKR